MKTRMLSTIVTLAAVATMAQAGQRNDVRVVTIVRDASGRPVQGASLKFYGPFGVERNRSELSTFTGRNGESEKTMSPGRYLVVASDVDRGIESKTIDVNDRNRNNTIDLRLHTTRRPTIQFVIMSDDLNEPVTNANIDIVCRETGRRDTLRSRGSGITQYEIPNFADAGKFDVMITSPDFDTRNVNLNFRPGSDTSSMLAYVQLRRKTGLSGRPDRYPPSRDSAKLDGMIRLSNRNRIEVGDVASINVGLMVSKIYGEKSQAISTVTVIAPNGAAILSDSHNVRLTLNQYVNTNYDVSTRMQGLYRVSVSAVLTDGAGVKSRWEGKFSFNVHGQDRDRGRDAVITDRGDYVGASDMELDSRSIRSHTLSLTLMKDSGSRDRVKGWLAPRGGSGFHISFEGTFDQNTGRLEARGQMSERTDKRWDINVTGSPDRNGRLVARVSIRATDNSYNRVSDFTLSKK